MYDKGRETLCGLSNQNCCLCYLSDYSSWNQICIGVRLICFEIASTHKSQCLKTLAPSNCTTYTHWSQGSSRLFLHEFLICKFISFSQSQNSLFPRGHHMLLLFRLSGEEKVLTRSILFCRTGRICDRDSTGPWRRHLLLYSLHPSYFPPSMIKPSHKQQTNKFYKET